MEKVSLRSDSAGCRKELLLYCGEGGNTRFGEIDFAVSVDVTAAFGVAVRKGREADRHSLTRRDENGLKTGTGQEGAGACRAPNRAGRGRPLADHRFPALREPLRAPGDEGMLLFPVAGFAARGRCKPFGVMTGRREAGDDVIRRHGERCGGSEEAHAAPESNPDGGRMPSGKFGANAAWWAIAVMAHNLDAAMKKPAPGSGWAHRRMKALRFHLIALPGRVVRHARRQGVRLSVAADTLAWILSVQGRIRALARASPGQTRTSLTDPPRPGPRWSAPRTGTPANRPKGSPAAPIAAPNPQHRRQPPGKHEIRRPNGPPQARWRPAADLLGNPGCFDLLQFWATWSTFLTCSTVSEPDTPR